MLVSEIRPPSTDADRSRIVATVKGEAITLDEVENSLRPEAQKRKITTTALLDTEVKPKAVTDEKAQLFYDQNKEQLVDCSDPRFRQLLLAGFYVLLSAFL